MHHALVRLSQSGALLAAMLFAGHAAAQSPGASATSGAPAHPWEDLGGALSGYRLSAPARLSLIGTIVPMASMFPQCSTREDAVGNSVGGIPVQHYIDWRIAPRLVFSAFTQLGCPIDAGLGGVFTYEVPLRSSLSLVFAAGMYAAPGQLGLFGGLPALLPSLLNGMRGGPTMVPAQVRMDLVWHARGRLPYNLGVESRGPGRQQVSFGGGF
jgi:hypothetical protein